MPCFANLQPNRVLDLILDAFESKPTNLCFLPLIERFRRYYGCGLWAGKLFCMLMALDFIFFRLLEWVFPRSGIDLVPAFPTSAFQAMPIARKLGNPNMAKLYAERYGVPESRHV